MSKVDFEWSLGRAGSLLKRWKLRNGFGYSPEDFWTGVAKKHVYNSAG
jgi:hypothetical protein